MTNVSYTDQEREVIAAFLKDIFLPICQNSDDDPRKMTNTSYIILAVSQLDDADGNLCVSKFLHHPAHVLEAMNIAKDRNFPNDPENVSDSEAAFMAETIESVGIPAELIRRIAQKVGGMVEPELDKICRIHAACEAFKQLRERRLGKDAVAAC